MTLGVLAAGPQSPDFISAQTLEPATSKQGRRAAASARRRRLAWRLPRAGEAEQARAGALRGTDGEGDRQGDRGNRKLWTSTVLNLWTQPGEKAKKRGEVDAGLKVLVTGRSLFGRDEIVVDGKSRWVTRGYLTDEKPFTLGGACTNGTSVEGVSENIVARCTPRSVPSSPRSPVYGGLRGGGGDHGTGHALDIMVSGDRGWQVAEFVRKYYVELGVSYVIYSQNIWSVERGGEGWRGMSSRGSATANHYDHVHVSVF